MGSHVVKTLEKSGYFTVVYDNLSTGRADWIPDAELVVGDIGDQAALSRVFKRYSFDAVIHLAARVSAPESIKKPLRYYADNLCGSIALLKQSRKHQIPCFIHASSAAVYGNPGVAPVGENAPLLPINPYGASKMMAERAIMDISGSSDMRWTILRYFNVAGADVKTCVGQRPENPVHLIPKACRAAGLGQDISIFGDDYDTIDGSCVRDYIHVKDLAHIHLLALEYLAGKNPSIVLNCGLGRGSSVKEVLNTAQRVSGKNFTVNRKPRRPGDAPVLVADNALLKKTLNWTPRYQNVSEIIETSWICHQRLTGRRSKN